MDKDKFIIDDLLRMKFVVGYQLPISPTNYQVNIEKGNDDHTIVMTSTYDVSRKDGCGVPFNFLKPMCKRRKQVVDHFSVIEENSTLVLQSTNAFYGLISCFEKGKRFRVIKKVGHFVVLVNQKEVFVLSPDEQTPTQEDQNQIYYDVRNSGSSPNELKIVYL